MKTAPIDHPTAWNPTTGRFDRVPPPTNSTPGWRTFLFVLLICSAFVVSGCETLGLMSPGSVPEAWVRADRATWSTIAPEFAAYIEEDASLTPSQKSNRLALLADWDLRVRAAEQSLELVDLAIEALE